MRDYAKHKPASRLHGPWLKWPMLFGLLYLGLLTIEHYAHGADLFKEHLSKSLPIPHQSVATAPTLPKPLSVVKIEVKSGDNLSKIFHDQHLNNTDLNQIFQMKKYNGTLSHLLPHHLLTLSVDPSHHLQQLIYSVDPLHTLVINNTKEHYQASTVEHALDKRYSFAHASIQESLSAAGHKAGIDEDVIMQLSNIFGWDIDFSLDVRPGDSFSVLYEERFIDGQKVGNGPILIAEFTNQGKVYRAIRYTDEHGDANYYAPSGQSLKKAFLRSPVKFTRISSRFNLGRKHPILHRIRAHKGVDYAAPTGTPVKAAGDGKVIFVGQKGGYGNAIILKHGRRYTTLYGHLSRFADHLKRNMSVKQGQTIAFVGSTGLATGPHLHFEFRVGGVHRNPLTVKFPQNKPISKKFREKFKQQTQNLLAKLTKQEQVYLALEEDTE